MSADTANRLENASIQRLKGVGPALAEKLERVGITTPADLLFHLPIRYEDRTRISSIGQVRVGQGVVIEGEVINVQVAYGRRRSLLAHLKDHSGVIGLRFYHFSKAQQANLEKAGTIRCYGEVRRGAAGMEIYHPEYTTSLNDALDDALTPIYPTTEGLSQSRLRALVSQVLDLLEQGRMLDELLVEKEPGIVDAIRQVHRPMPDDDLEALEAGQHPVQQRLAFEELLAHHTSMRLVREEVSKLKSWPIKDTNGKTKALLAQLGFELTGAQKRVAREIADDMSRKTPMMRLVQGDVGSGKTIIAAMAAVSAVENGLQAAIMAPTEILAEQHFINFSNWLAPLGITTTFLSSKIKGKRRVEELSLIESGTAGVVIGTHALFQADVTFNKLGLVVIDEQHRFGVHQRLALREKGEKGHTMPHQLVMTATPIPRTLTMSLYADMDSSVIDELPPGRTPIVSSVLPDTRRADIVERVRSACASGAQAYWVCTLIEESDVIESQAAEETAKLLAEALDELEVGLVHGRMTAADKAKVMNRFKQGDIDLLVATTVIEVGVDVPNASLMIIENAERLGLAQLHQLRGRVGRGSRESYCLLLYHPPLGETSKLRLNVMRETSDGFRIAEADLSIRGPGEVLGTRQSGSLSFRIADLVRDSHMLGEVKALSQKLLKDDRERALAIMNRWLVSAEKLSQV